MRHPPAIAAYRVGMTADMGTASDAAALVTRLVRVRGRVQGIGYREACVRRARALGVTGWVRNRMDASVEAMLQGSPLQLEAMCAWLDEGMPAALVEGMEVIEVPAPFPRFDRFEQLPTL
ncbi:MULTISPECIES: acylphosphatase [Ralstonia solanacearum species complex]|uniref:acylphosphatase n=4 Tax=Ralstonia solanacearum species complex TaxID=3116862 RepID=A0A0S4X566_RALSL|nr:acylphosphatase [Ralstonia pseudosolanacearum]CUV25966.1 Acylphosphatase 1 [Ralstonia solanacearum]MCL1620924.1 acylphosphatase [Ralstonia pseudosolanacearum CaRs-Mep]MCQ4679536.1 acylphosphatase [Ralstonia pseudosolanacearum]MDO3523716.1 acylphosphatase [Ralstonia pseudosolanacearum]MDO3547605.1 acylphosphatase [Ralstonia pseudosolanacearum]